MRVEHEGDAAAWVTGTLMTPNVQGHRLPQPRELWPYQSLFLFVCLFVCLFVEPLVASNQKASLVSLSP